MMSFVSLLVLCRIFCPHSRTLVSSEKKLEIYFVECICFLPKSAFSSQVYIWLAIMKSILKGIKHTFYQKALGRKTGDLVKYKFLKTLAI